MIVLLDYGMGNLGSAGQAIRHLGYEFSVQTDLAGATKLIIPGVGAFATAMERLAPLKRDIAQFAKDGLPIMGICLGQQLLFESSEEHGATTGLELLGGAVKYLPQVGKKIPHIGWSELFLAREATLTSGVKDGDSVYFVHSLYCEAEEEVVAATAEYGIRFPAAVQHKNIWGTQFHPEKSGEVGLRILRNFLEC